MSVCESRGEESWIKAAVKQRFHLRRLPQDVDVLVLPGVDVLTQKPEQLRETGLRARPGEA